MVGEIITFYHRILACRTVKPVDVEVTKPYDSKSTTDFSKRGTIDDEPVVRRSSTMYSTLDCLTICVAGPLGKGPSKRWIRRPVGNE